jgi:large subunit ribosomal protein L25
MSNVVSILVEQRDDLGSANSRRLRGSGRIPAVLYGRGVESISLSVASADSGKLLGHTGVVELNSDHNGKRKAILREVQRHTITGKIMHIDFQVVRDDELITVPVPVVSFGEPAGLKQGGQLEQVIRELEIECLPAAVPEMIRIDVSDLEMDQAFHIGNLQLDEGVKVVGDDELIIFQVRAPRVSEEPVEEEEAVAEDEEAAEKAAEDEDTQNDA